MDSLFPILSLLFFVVVCDSAKILAVFPTPSVSHQVVFRPLIKELACRGHDVTVLTTDPEFKDGETPANLTEIDVHDVSYKLWRDNYVYKFEFGKKYMIYKQIEAAIGVMRKLTVIHLRDENIQKLMKDPNQFDVILLEAWTRLPLVYSYVFKAPVILVSSFGFMIENEDALGIPTHPFLYSLSIQQRIYNTTFWEKINELYLYMWFKRLWYGTENEEIDAVREVLGPELPSYDELKNNIDMMFLNVHTTWIDNQPLPRNVISIWGIHKKPEKVLPNDLQAYLDSSKDGVIYISFGTNAPSSTLPPVFIQLLIRVFSKLPYDVLWKWETDELPGRSANIKISKWLPQSDLLKHKNVKLFITQGGLQSTDEAITAGVPLIGIPMLGDQWYNVEKYEKHKIGKRLDMETITEDELEASIKAILNDTSFKENIIQLRTVMKDEPENALDRAVWWTEYVVRHGGAKHRRAAAANMSWAEYFEIEFIFKILMLTSCSIIVVIKALYLSYMNVIRNIIYPTKIKVS